MIVGYDLDPALVATLPQHAGSRHPAPVRAPLTAAAVVRRSPGGTATDVADRVDRARRARVPATIRRAWRRSDRKPHVLVVEATRSTSGIAVKMLARLGYRVDTANNGFEATARIAGYVFVLMMARCRKWMATKRRSGIPAMEAHASPAHRSRRSPPTRMAADRERCLPAGMDALPRADSCSTLDGPRGDAGTLRRAGLRSGRRRPPTPPLVELSA